MSNEGKLDKRVFTIRVDVETCVKAEKKYGQDDDKSWRDSIVRALEDATRDFPLSPDDYRAIADEIEANKEARADKRNKRG